MLSSPAIYEWGKKHVIYKDEDKDSFAWLVGCVLRPINSEVI